MIESISFSPLYAFWAVHILTDNNIVFCTVLRHQSKHSNWKKGGYPNFGGWLTVWLKRRDKHQESCQSFDEERKTRPEEWRYAADPGSRSVFFFVSFCTLPFSLRNLIKCRGRTNTSLPDRVAGLTVKLIAHCVTFITGEILGRFNKWFCLLSSQFVNSILTMGLPTLQSDGMCTVSLLQTTQSKDSTIYLVKTIGKNWHMRYIHCFSFKYSGKIMKWNRLEISIPYSYNVSGDMGVIRLIGGTITSCHFSSAFPSFVKPSFNNDYPGRY